MLKLFSYFIIIIYLFLLSILCYFLDFCEGFAKLNNLLLHIRDRIYQASQSAILVLSAENSWNVLLLPNLSIKASYQIS